MSHFSTIGQYGAELLVIQSIVTEPVLMSLGIARRDDTLKVT